MNTIQNELVLPVRFDLTTLPVTPEAAPLSGGEASPASPAGSVNPQTDAAPAPEETGPLALVIEDDEDLSTIFFEALRASGFRPEVMHDGALGVARLQAVTPYLVVLDLHLPHINGLKILRDIRGDARLKDTRVVVVTADPRMADDARPLSDITLIKPVSFGLMREMTSRFKIFAARPRSE
jgi:CheY-like chemotaxis protein